ncbi:nucleoside-diphosphate kinase [Patescibacteria group bacterium]|nr:nucleoside-diphosphate kinase [Patescibacteria group bacterium]
MERTVVLVKPDGVKRGLVGEIVGRFEKVGLKIVAMKMVWVDEELAGKHYPTSRADWVKKVGDRTLGSYKEYGQDANELLGTMDPVEVGKLVCKWLVGFLTGGPVVAMVLEGPHAVEIVRKMVGHTYPLKANPGTIRGDLMIDSPAVSNTKKRAIQNLVHASGSPEEAKFEMELWFHKNEIHDYKRVDEELMFG